MHIFFKEYLQIFSGALLPYFLPMLLVSMELFKCSIFLNEMAIEQLYVLRS